jgi:chloramphenicol-sensitive protein RarD
LWGSFPIIIQFAKFATAFEIVVWRVVFGFLFAAALVTITGTWKQIWSLAKSPKKLGWIAVAAFFIFINWEVYVYGVVSENVIEASLGYFINPLVTVMFAVVILKEKLRPRQWLALGVGLIAVIVLTVDYGRPPWIAITLALSFGTYSLAKNKVGKNVGALQSFTIESAMVLPVAIIQLAVVASFGPVMILAGPMEASVLIGYGILTAVPLILFGAAARRLPLAMMGFIQYLTPLLQFGTGYFLLGEQMPPARWIGFGLIWVSLIILSSDLFRKRPAALVVEAL